MPRAEKLSTEEAPASKELPINKKAPPGKKVPVNKKISAPEEPPQAPPPIPLAWVFVLSAFVIVAALGSVIVWLFGAASHIQYPMMVALLCFVLSTVACLLFASQAKIQATLPIAAITMGGPAVTWIATLIIFSYIFPTPPVTQQSFVDVLRAQQLREGWRTFPDWIKQLGELGSEVLQDEATHVRWALDSVYYTGLGRQKLGSPLIGDLFAYVDEENSIEFQHVRGSKADVAEIYFRSHTTQGDRATSLLLAKSGDAIVVNELSGKRDWRDIRSEALDCLIVTLYPEGMLTKGDLLYLNVNKYRKDGSAVLDVGILTSQPIQEPKVWWLRGFAFPLTDEIPVVFKKASASWQQGVEPVITQFADWFSLLDREPSDGRLSKESLKFLEDVRAKLPDGKFATLHTSARFQTRYSLHLDHITDDVSITFEKK